jgi:hypothetical protein
MTYEEFLLAAKEVSELDKDFDKQLRALFVQKGTLKQLVRAILDYRMDISVAFERSDIVSEDAVKVAIGLQGQIRGIDNILALIHELMTQTKPEEEEDA